MVSRREKLAAGVAFWIHMVLITAAIGGFVVAAVVDLDFLGDDGKSCSAVEYAIQEAAWCAASDDAERRRRQRLAQVYGVELPSCHSLLQESSRLGLTVGEIRSIGRWTKDHDKSLRTYWREVRGSEFCADAASRQWLSRSAAR